MRKLLFLVALRRSSQRNGRSLPARQIHPTRPIFVSVLHAGVRVVQSAFRFVRARTCLQSSPLRRHQRLPPPLSLSLSRSSESILWFVSLWLLEKTSSSNPGRSGGSHLKMEPVASVDSHNNFSTSRTYALDGI